MKFKPKIVPLGDSALLIQAGADIDSAINQRVHALSALLKPPYIALLSRDTVTCVS